MQKSLYTILIFYKINTKRFFRDKLSIFFGIGFPLIFLFVFGGLNSNSGDASFKVAILSKSNTAIATQFIKESNSNPALKVDKTITTLDQAKEKMSRSEIDATIVLPKEFGSTKKDQPYPSGQLEVIYTQNNQSSASALSSLLDAQFKPLNAKYVDTKVPFEVKGTQLNEKSLTAFDYSFAGLLGFAIIGIGIFGPINVFPELKKMGILRRLSTTPLKVWQYFVATMLGQATIGLVSLAVMFIVAITVFHLEVVGNIAELIVFTVFSIMMILGIGLSIGGWAKNERQAAPLSNIIVFPMMFLSGTFFPRFLMPEWLQNLSGLLPLTPVIDGIRLITTEGQHLLNLGPQLGLMAIWMILIYSVAFRVFRWE